MEIRSAQPGGDPTRRIRVLHTNDVHGAISPVPDRVVLGRPAELGGSAWLATMVSRLRAEDPGRTLLLDAGDAVHGQLSTDLDRGNSMVEVMGEVGYDAATLGNHDFQWGVRALEERLGHARYPVVIANVVRDDGSALPHTVTHRLFDLDGVQVGVTGLLTSETGRDPKPGRVEGVRFLDEEASLRRSLAELRAEGAEVVLVMSHQGLERDRLLAAKFPGEGLVFLGGHSHDRLAEPVEVAGNHIVQAGSMGRELGDLVLDLRGRSIVGVHHRLLPVDPATVAPDPEVAALVARYEERADREMGRVLTTLPQRLTRSGQEDSPVGSFVADALREAAGTQIGFINSGCLRTDLEAGPLTRKDLYGLMPFGGEVMHGTMTGRQILEALEHSASNRPRSPGDETPFLQVSGVRFAYDASRPAGQRILEAKVGDHPLHPEATYSVAMDDFLAAGHDGYGAFARAPFASTGTDLLSALADFAATSPRTAPPGSRIQDRTPD